MSRPECCATCRGTRYCAPLRCYCGHTACPAFASYVDMAASFDAIDAQERGS